ncbi:Brain protein I3 [Plecturocebus cupreus]
MWQTGLTLLHRLECSGAITTHCISDLLDSRWTELGWAAMDHKPLLQEWLPTYNLGAGQGDGACSPRGYGAILLPTPSRCLPSPYLITGIPTHHPRVYNGHSWTITRYPANAILIMRGCPVCRVGC